MSVCGTGTNLLARGLSPLCEINDSRKTCFLSPSQLDLNEYRICLILSLTAWTYNPIVRFAYPTASPPSLKTIHGGTGISTCYPSPTPVGLSLGPDYPRADEPSSGNLSQSVDGILTRLSLLTPAFSLLSAPHVLAIMLQRP